MYTTLAIWSYLFLFSKFSDAFTVPKSNQAFTSNPSLTFRSKYSSYHVPTDMSQLSSTASDETETEELEMVTMEALEAVITGRPMGLVLQENVENEARGVYILECPEDSLAYAAGAREGDVVASIGDTEVISSTFDDVMEKLAQSDLPANLKLYREIPASEVMEAQASPEKKTVKMAPRRMPSAKKIMRASTNAKFWQDPMMMASAALTVAMPLGIYLLSTGSKGP